VRGGAFLLVHRPVGGLDRVLRVVAALKGVDAVRRRHRDGEFAPAQWPLGDCIGERRWRLLLPYPKYESTIDVVELTPAD